MADRYAIDAHKLIYHPERVAEWHEAQGEWEKAKKVYPIYVEISPTGACNHRCGFCAVDYVGYPRRALDPGMLAERLPEMGALGIRSVMYAGEGEPLLHPEIAAIARLTRQAGIDVAFTTNGVAMTERFVQEALSDVQWIKVSLNAGRAETYARVHGTRAGDFDRVVRNLKRAVEVRDANHLPCTLGAQLLLIPQNAAEVRGLALLCRDEIGLDYLVVKPYSQHPSSLTRVHEGIDYGCHASMSEDLAPLSDDRFSLVFRGHTMAKTREPEAERYRKCNATPFFWAYVMSDGSVWGCSAYLLDPRFEYGNLNQAGFREIWEGKRREESWRHVREAMDIRECRRNCRMDEINRYLYRLNRGLVPHVNFI